MTIKSLLIPLFPVLLWLTLMSPGYADVYKWIDENGQVHYGEKPGASGAQQLTIRKNETTKARAIKSAKEDQKNQTGNISDTSERTDNTPQTEPKPVPVPVPKNEKNRLCKQAKEDVANIISRGRMREINSKGEYSYLSEKQRQQRLATATKNQKKYCR